MKTKSKNKSTKRNGRRSMKGKMNGKVGAPPKTTHFPKTPFTIAALKKRNTNQCELSLRNKVDDMLDNGDLIPISPRKQANGGVGRPAPRYIIKSEFNSEKHTKVARPVKTGKHTPAAPVVAATVPVVDVVAPAAAPEVVLAPPVEVAPATPEISANVIPVPAPSEAPMQTEAALSQVAA